MPTLKSITIYPIKSFDGLSQQSAAVLDCGALENDRRFALMDEKERFVNAKRYAAIHRLRASFAADLSCVALRGAGEASQQVFSLQSPWHELQDWLSRYFEVAVTVVENHDGGLPDDTDASGPTIVSTATLEEVASWFPGLTAEEVRVRFRPNLEIDGVEPFWEDRLFAEKGQVVRFTIGEVQFDGVNPCQRCPVPTRNPWSGEVYPHFARLFQERRQASLPSWVARSRFDHFYRLTVNTRGVNDATAVPRVIHVGDEVRIVEVKNVG
jgi:uncharacterized protein YcbX